MTCDPGYSDPANYPRLDPMPILPWDKDGSPCRETYMGALEKAWWDFIAASDSCKVDANGCVETTCLTGAYAAYLSTITTAQADYIGCK